MGAEKKNRDLKYYLGGTVPCLGDSGGPLYKFAENKNGDERAYLLGVISRGRDCAKLNDPEVYTDVFRLWQYGLLSFQTGVYKSFA